MNKIIIDAVRNGYDPSQCEQTLTVGELQDILSEYDTNAPIYLSFDQGYTYGSLSDYQITETENSL